MKIRAVSRCNEFEMLQIANERFSGFNPEVYISKIFVQVHTSTHWYIPVYWYILVHTGTYWYILHTRIYFFKTVQANAKEIYSVQDILAAPPYPCCIEDDLDGVPLGDCWSLYAQRRKEDSS